MTPARAIAGPSVAATGLDWAMFDLDGCLVDSWRAIPSCINAALATLDLPQRAPADLRWCIGPPLAASIEQLLVNAGEVARPDRVARALDAYRMAYDETGASLTSVVPGIPELLEAIPQRRAIMTSKPADPAAALVDTLGLGDFFEHVYGPAAGIEHEPKSSTLARALSSLEIRDPATVVMVGDRHQDVDAGRHHGTTTVGVTWGSGDHVELTAAHADHVVDTPDELCALLAASGRVSG